MKKAKRTLSMILAVLMLVCLFAACGGGGGTEQGGQSGDTTPVGDSGNGSGNAPQSGDASGDGEVKYKEELTVIVDTQMTTLNRYIPGITDNAYKWAIFMFADRLVEEDANGEYQPMLATEWNTDDYKTFTFKLRDDVYFHNGEQFTADDVVYTFERAKESVGSEAYDNIGRSLESIEAVSDFEVKITLNEVNVDYIHRISVAPASIANREACEADAEKGTTIGSGPWKVDNFISGESINFSRNDDYWGEIPKTQKMTFLYVAEEATRMIMLENEEAELVFGTNFYSDYPLLESDDRFQVFDFVANNPGYVCFNTKDPICGDLNFRKAVAAAVDKETYATVSRSGYAIPIEEGTFWGYRTEFMNTDIEAIPYDLDLAKEYLDQSSYNGEEVVITCTLPNFISDAQILQESLKSIGINAVVNQTDLPSTLAAATYSDSKIQILVLTDNWDSPASSVNPFYTPGGSANRAVYDNQEIVDLIEKATTVTDEAEREAIYKQVQELAAADVPWVATYYIRHLAGALNGVEGVDLRPSTMHHLEYVCMAE